MKSTNMKAMSLDQLIALRKKVAHTLSIKVDAERRKLQSRLDGLSSFDGRARRGAKKSALKGRKVSPKYRGPKGETWAGRGMRPLWLTALLRQGRKIQEFAVGNTTAPKLATKRRPGKRK